MHHELIRALPGAILVGILPGYFVRPGVLFAVLDSAVVLYHQVASSYLALLLAPLAALYLPYLLLRHRRRGLALLLSFSLLGFISAVYAWDTYDLGRLVGGLLGGSDAGAGGAAVTNAIGSQEPSGLQHLVEMTSQPVLWLGILGACSRWAIFCVGGWACLKRWLISRC